MEGLSRIPALVLLFGLQLVLGTAIYAGATSLLRFDRSGPARRRRRLVAWTASTRALCRTLPYSAGLVVCAAIVHLVGAGSRMPDLSRPWSRPLAFFACAALSTASCYVLLHAGSRESRGELRRARAEARLGGRLLFLGVFALQVLVWSALILDSSFRRASVASSTSTALLLTTALLMLGLAAFVALVAGLAGKPRPSGPFAVALYLIGTVGLLAATAAARTAVR